jgi:uncharacterized protein (DUF885 family)
MLFSLSSLIFCQIQSANPESRKLAGIFESYYQEYLLLYPRQATEFGDHRYDDQFENDISEAHREKVRAFYTKYREQIKGIQRDQLTREDRFSLDVFQDVLRTGIEELGFRNYLMPINQMICVPMDFAEWGSGRSAQPFNTVKDYESFLKRIDGYLTWVDTAIANMREGVKEGIVLPKLIAFRTVQRMAPMVVTSAEESIFFEPIRTMPASFSTDDRKRLKDAYKDAILNRIIPSYRKLVDFMGKEYLPRCRDSVGWSGLPGGKAWYEHLVRFYTTTDMTPDKIFELGEREVNRIFKEYQRALKNRPHERPLAVYRSKKKLIKRYTQLTRKILPQLKSHFGIVPKTPLDIRTTLIVTHYEPGSADGSRPGTLYIQANNIEKYPAVVSESLFLHEAYPGHHFQMSIQRESTLPQFRRMAFYTAYIEGWGLYSESLGRDLGVYRDPRQRRWQLQSELWRALRLVLDVGIHTRGWSVKQALAYIKPYGFGNGSTQEIERYIAFPGQALAYKIGELQIMKLRERARRTLGKRFDLASFHREILTTGPVPLRLLEEKMNRWMASRGAVLTKEGKRN